MEHEREIMTKAKAGSGPVRVRTTLLGAGKSRAAPHVITAVFHKSRPWCPRVGEYSLRRLLLRPPSFRIDLLLLNGPAELCSDKQERMAQFRSILSRLETQ